MILSVINGRLILERYSAHIVVRFVYHVLCRGKIDAVIFTCTKISQGDRIAARIVSRLAADSARYNVGRDKSADLVSKGNVFFSIGYRLGIRLYRKLSGRNLYICVFGEGSRLTFAIPRSYRERVKSAVGYVFDLYFIGSILYKELGVLFPRILKHDVCSLVRYNRSDRAEASVINGAEVIELNRCGVELPLRIYNVIL